MAEKTLVAKLAEVMAEVSRVPKRGHNDFQNYDYVMEADLSDAVREKLAERGVIVIPEVISHTRGADDKVDTVMVKFTFHDSTSDKSLSVTMPGSGYDKGDKGVYKAITGATKYFLMKTFLIPTGDDPESDTRTDRDAGEKAAKKIAEAKLQEIEQEKKIKAQEQAMSHSSAAPGSLISDKQRKRMYAIWKAAGWSDDEARQFLKGKYGIEHTDKVPRDLYEEICNTFESGTQPNSKESVPF